MKKRFKEALAKRSGCKGRPVSAISVISNIDADSIEVKEAGQDEEEKNED